MTAIVRDKRPPFFMLPNAFIDTMIQKHKLNPATSLVYIALSRTANSGQTDARISQEHLATMLNVHRSTVNESCAKLRALGLIEIHANGKAQPSTITLTWEPFMALYVEQQRAEHATSVDVSAQTTAPAPDAKVDVGSADIKNQSDVGSADTIKKRNTTNVSSTYVDDVPASPKRAMTLQPRTRDDAPTVSENTSEASADDRDHIPRAAAAASTRARPSGKYEPGWSPHDVVVWFEQRTGVKIAVTDRAHNHARLLIRAGVKRDEADALYDYCTEWMSGVDLSTLYGRVDRWRVSQQSAPLASSSNGAPRLVPTTSSGKLAQKRALLAKLESDGWRDDPTLRRQYIGFAGDENRAHAIDATRKAIADLERQQAS